MVIRLGTYLKVPTLELPPERTSGAAMPNTEVIPIGHDLKRRWFMAQTRLLKSNGISWPARVVFILQVEGKHGLT